jgi:hypothetical protein
LIGGMFVIQWVMRRWTLWKNQFTLWRNLRAMEEAREASRGLRHEDQPDFVPDSHLYRARSDVESIGTRALLGRR